MKGRILLMEQREDLILSLLKENGELSVRDLAARLYMSEPTARRAVAELERRGLLIRSHGILALPCTGEAEIPLDYRTRHNVAQKRALCRKAATLVHDHSLIFLDASSTVRYMVDSLKGKTDVTVVTNSVRTAIALKEKKIDTLCTGGTLTGVSLSFVGEYAVDFTDRFRFDAVFFSAHGVLPDGEIVDTSEGEALLRRHLFRRSAMNVFLVDREKLGRNALYSVGTLAEIDYAVTNAPNLPMPPEKILLAE